MFDDMSDAEILIRMERNYGPLRKKIVGAYTVDVIEKIEAELVQMLQKYKSKYNLTAPMPRIRMWIEENRINFLFFNRENGKRVILGEWLTNKDGFYEH